MGRGGCWPQHLSPHNPHRHPGKADHSRQTPPTHSSTHFERRGAQHVLFQLAQQLLVVKVEPPVVIPGLQGVPRRGFHPRRHTALAPSLASATGSPGSTGSGGWSHVLAFEREKPRATGGKACRATSPSTAVLVRRARCQVGGIPSREPHSGPGQLNIGQPGFHAQALSHPPSTSIQDLSECHHHVPEGGIQRAVGAPCTLPAGRPWLEQGAPTALGVHPRRWDPQCAVTASTSDTF